MNQYGTGGQRRGQRDAPDETVKKHWPDYLKGGYFDAPSCLRVEFVQRSTVEKLARIMGERRLTTSQLRRFFGHCRRIEARLKSGDVTWRESEADFKRLDAAAADAFGKKKLPAVFHDFIRCNVAAVKNETDFLKGFIPHFEALVGFASGKLQERN